MNNINNNMDKIKKKTARETALKYLSYRDRTLNEIKKHLTGKGFSQEEIEDTLIYLSEFGFINDKDYCERYIRFSIEKGRGPLRIERELLDKGIAAETISIGIEAEFNSTREREFQLAYEHVQKILKNKEAKSCFQQDEIETVLEEKEIARIARRLNSQGYHTGVIYEVIGKLRKNL
ncbi:MAG: regulatory protein RecX [Anaerovoracaceae bacterium]|jgi:regulatory protein